MIDNYFYKNYSDDMINIFISPLATQHLIDATACAWTSVSLNAQAIRVENEVLSMPMACEPSQTRGGKHFDRVNDAAAVRAIDDELYFVTSTGRLMV